MAKEHKKLYKAGKNWLVASVVTLALIGGVAVTANTETVHADTISSLASTNQTTDLTNLQNQKGQLENDLQQAQIQEEQAQQIYNAAQQEKNSDYDKWQQAQNAQKVAQDNLNQQKSQAQQTIDDIKNDQLTERSNAVNNQINQTEQQIQKLKQQRESLMNQENFSGFHYPESEGAVGRRTDLSSYVNQYHYVDNANDEQVVINDYANLDPEIQKELTIYAAQLMNGFAKEAWEASDAAVYSETKQHLNFQPLMINDASIAYANYIAKLYKEDNWQIMQHLSQNNGHDYDALKKAAMQFGAYPDGDEPIPAVDEAATGQIMPTGRSTTLNKLKNAVFNAILGMLYEDGQSSNGHLLSLIQAPYFLDQGISFGHDWFGLAFDELGQLHFDFAINTAYTISYSGQIYTGQNYDYQPYVESGSESNNSQEIENLNSEINNKQQQLSALQDQKSQIAFDSSLLTGDDLSRYNDAQGVINQQLDNSYQENVDNAFYDFTVSGGKLKEADEEYQGAKTKVSDLQAQIAAVNAQISSLQGPVDLSQNAGALDSYSAQNGKLHLAGWHVSSASVDYQYPYIIVLDNGREVGRAQAQLVDRPDVDRLYPNTNGRQAAGFTADVEIPTYAYGDRLTVIARFSNDPAGNGQYQDYYFNNLKPVTDLSANKASLDGYHLSTNSRNGDIQLNVAGWHAAGRSVTEGSHWLILFDNTTNSEIQRVKLSDADNYVVSRPDVARAFPGIANSGQSGFDGTFTLSRAELGHNLSVVARYSDDAVNGEGNRTDCWLAVPRLVNSQVNAGWVDNYHAERGTDGTGIDLVVSGWHVAGNSLAQPYHWVILYDNDTHREVVRMPVKDQASDFYGNPHFATQPILRPDVARQYQNVLDSNRSGFEARFALLQSTSQHSLSIISRYSDDATNGEGNHTDYWMPAMRLDQGNHANLENISLSGNQLHVSGWHATNQLGADEHVVILYDATQHRELSRQIVGRLARPDVAKAFPTIYNAADSGFSAAFDFQPEMAHDQIQIVSRWTSAGSENSDYVDYWFAPQLLVSDQSNRANLDDFSLANGQLTATGWHASNQALGKQYHYVILFDQTTGQELSRVETPLVQRPDVARAFPTILNAGDSGFNVNFAFDPAQLDGHRLAIVSRWTTDPAGNGNATDYWFAPQTFTVTQPTSRAVRGTGDGVGALDKWAVFINPALSSDNSNRIFFFASGWHASNAVTGRPYHDIMLIDNTTGQQVGGATYGNPMLPARDTSRPNIARLYGNQYQNAGESGFKIGLQTPRFTFGHRYTLVSRYASDENGSNAVKQSYYLGQINQDMVNYGDGHDFFN